MSENQSSADNQQGSLKFGYWLTGFVDGEGTFAISIFKNNTLKRGYQVLPEFTITQGEKSISVLYDIQNFLKCGKVYVNNRKDNHKENVYKFTVRNINDLINIIIPFFDEHNLNTYKINDFNLFKEACKLVYSKDHLLDEGFFKLVQLSEQINTKKSKSKVLDALRDYTLRVNVLNNFTKI
jgi:LAGLIDADG endonuclease